jgi:hypothetical protein
LLCSNDVAQMTLPERFCLEDFGAQIESRVLVVDTLSKSATLGRYFATC